MKRSPTGTRTRVSRVRAVHPNQLDYRGWKHRPQSASPRYRARKPKHVPAGRRLAGPVDASQACARSVAVSYKPPMLVTRVRLPACAVHAFSYSDCVRPIWESGEWSSPAWKRIPVGFQPIGWRLHFAESLRERDSRHIWSMEHSRQKA